jgi:hypothetical protein
MCRLVHPTFALFSKLIPRSLYLLSAEVRTDVDPFMVNDHDDFAVASVAHTWRAAKSAACPVMPLTA